MTKTVSILTAVLFCVVANRAAGVVGGSEPAPGDARFDCVCAFGTAGGVTVGNNFGSGTLIAPDMVLIAAHLAEPVGEVGAVARGPNRAYGVRFRRSPDGSIGSPTNPAGYHDVAVREIRYFGPMAATGYPGGVDAAILILDEPVTHIEPAWVATHSLDGAGAEAPLIVAGWGHRTADPSNCQSTRDRGQLRVANISATYVSDTLILWPDLCFGAGPALYDSGAGVFSAGCDGRLSLVAIVSYRIGGTSTGALRQTPGWSMIPRTPGIAAMDYDGDGMVGQNDFSLFEPLFTAGSACADIDDDGELTDLDIDLLVNAIGDIPRPHCPCDLTQDDRLDELDFFEFVNGYFLGLREADMDADGAVNEQDYFEFINCFFQCGRDAAGATGGPDGADPSEIPFPLGGIGEAVGLPGRP